MTLSVVIYAIIALIVLITLVWIFREQVNEIYKSFMSIIKITTSESEQVGEGFKELIKSNQ